jgi:tetratricopeptide (TPR) repeat protein
MRPLERLIEGVRNGSLLQVAGLYAAGAWVALQVVDVLVDAFDLPGRFAAIAIGLLVGGFPVVLATAFVQGRRRRSSPGFADDQAGGAGDGNAAVSPTARRLLNWRNVLGAGVTLAAVWGIVVTGWLLTRPPSEANLPSSVRPAISPSVVAVFPFSVRGSQEYAHLGEGMVSLLGIKLDGAGDLRSVDARALLSHVGRAGEIGDDAERAAGMAERFGAGLFVMGDVVEVGGRFQVAASLYKTADWSGAVTEASAEGDDAFALVDEVATQLLAGVEGGPGARVRRIAAVTTSSPPAFRAYLEGEAAFRVFDFEAAFGAFQRAVQLDTLYAMAYYRLSVVAEWLTRADDARQAAERAFRHASRLPERDRQLLLAFRAWRRGEHEEAERVYRAIVGTYPTDVEAWFQLGEVLFHANPLHGRPFAEAREPFEQVLEFEPRDMAALLHLIRLASKQGRLDDLDSLAERYLEVNRASDRTVEVESLLLLAEGNPSRVDSLLRAYAGLSDLQLSQVVWNGCMYTGSRSGCEAAAGLLTNRGRFTSEVWTVGHSTRAYSLIARGRVGQAMAEADSIATYDPMAASQVRAFLHLVPLVPTNPDELRRLARDVESYDPASHVASGNPSFFFNVPESRYGLARLYLAGSLAAEAGDAGSARAFAERIAALAGDAESSPMPSDLAAGLRAHAAASGGRPAEALRHLESIRAHSFYQLAMASPFDGLVRERYARGVTLQELGRGDEALGWLAHLAEVGVAELAFLPAATLRRAEIHESLGRNTDAAREYAAFVQMWENADPELQPVVEAARTAMLRLAPDGPAAE